MSYLSSAPLAGVSSMSVGKPQMSSIFQNNEMNWARFISTIATKNANGQLDMIAGRYAVPQMIGEGENKQLSITPNKEFVIDTVNETPQHVALHCMLCCIKATAIPPPLITAMMPNPKAFDMQIAMGGIRRGGTNFHWQVLNTNFNGTVTPGYTFTIQGKTSLELMIDDGKKDKAADQTKLKSIYSYKMSSSATKKYYEGIQNGMEQWNNLVQLVMSAFSEKTIRAVTGYAPEIQLSFTSPVKIFTTKGELTIPIREAVDIGDVLEIQISNWIRLDHRFRLGPKIAPALQTDMMSVVKSYYMNPFIIVDRTNPTAAKIVSLEEVSNTNVTLPNGTSYPSGSSTVMTFEGVCVWETPFITCADAEKIRELVAASNAPDASGKKKKMADNINFKHMGPTRLLYKNMCASEAYRAITAEENDAAVADMAALDM